MGKQTIKKNMEELARYFEIRRAVPWREAVEKFGLPQLKKARKLGIVRMDPDPHTGRRSRKVGQKVSRLLPGWARKGKKEDTVTNTRYGNNVVPRTVIYMRGSKNATKG